MRDQIPDGFGLVIATNVGEVIDGGTIGDARAPLRGIKNAMRSHLMTVHRVLLPKVVQTFNLLTDFVMFSPDFSRNTISPNSRSDQLLVSSVKGSEAKMTDVASSTGQTSMS